MSYIPNVWSSTDLVTAAKMNHIEDGISSALTRAWEIEITTSQWTFDDELDKYKFVASLENIDEATWIDVNLGDSNAYLTAHLYWQTDVDTLVFSTENIPNGTLNVTVAAWGTMEGGSSDSGVVKAEGVYPVYTGELSAINKNSIVCATGGTDLPTSLVNATAFTVITQRKSDTERAQFAFAYGGEKVVMRVMSNGTYGNWFILSGGIADDLVTNDGTIALSAKQGKVLKDSIDALQIAPLALTIPVGQWSQGSDYYYVTINASNVTANSILVPSYDKTGLDNLAGPIWCVPSIGSFTLRTSALPRGEVNVLIQFPGVMGEANYQVLADVYSKSQTYSKTEAVAKADIVNNLTNTSTTAPLSAAMGKALNEKIKSTTVTITTSSAGVSGLLSNSKIVYAIVCNTANVYPMFVPFIGTNGTTYVMVFDYSTTALTKLVNTQLNVTVYYQDLPA